MTAYVYRLPTEGVQHIPVPEGFTTRYVEPGTEPDIPPLPDDLAAARAEVEKVASDNGRHQQYIGHFDDWQFATANCEIRGSWERLIAKAGERVLATEDDEDPDKVTVFGRHGDRPGQFGIWASQIDFDDDTEGATNR